jgi:hypothetical protein
MWETRTEAYEALEAAGVSGGPVVTHPYRTNERANNLYETAVEAGEVEEDTGRWRFLRETADDWEEMSRYIEAAPHYHVPIAPRRYVEGESAPDGWVVKRVRKLRAFDLRDTESYRDMAASAYYVLTHTADQEGRQSTTWFGDLHPSGFDPEEELTAAKWSRIQMEAEKAVREEPGEGDQEGSGHRHGPEECPREGCEAAVLDAMYLDEYLDDEEWVAAVRDRPGGRRRLAILRGARAWWSNSMDPPSASARDKREAMLEWLKHRGQKRTASSGSSQPCQSSLSSSLMG